MIDADRNKASRRNFLKVATGITTTALGLSLMPRFAEAFSMPHVSSLNDPTAKAMNYVEDASTTKNALHKTGSACANCQLYMGPANGYGPCQLYPGKAVSSKGWCTSYTPKAAG